MTYADLIEFWFYGRNYALFEFERTFVFDWLEDGYVATNRPV